MTITRAQLGGQTMDWVAPTLGNSWVIYSTHTVGYRKDRHGFVYLRGAIASGTLSTVVFNLPAGYRPSHASIFSNSNAAASTLTRIDVTPAGDVVIYNGTNAMVSLSQVVFQAAW